MSEWIVPNDDEKDDELDIFKIMRMEAEKIRQSDEKFQKMKEVMYKDMPSLRVPSIRCSICRIDYLDNIGVSYCCNRVVCRHCLILKESLDLPLFVKNNIPSSVCFDCLTNIYKVTLEYNMET